MNHTALYADHVKLGAKTTEFHGWDMPLYYSSILEEHRSVRQSIGLFDISHMGQVVVTGQGATDMLNALVVSDLTQVGERRACYTLLVNERGGILDDVLVYRLGPQQYLLIVNCANRAADVDWLRAHQQAGVELRDLSAGRSILAIQGPRAAELLDSLTSVRPSSLGRFSVAPVPEWGEQAWIARTGYTGSDGFEVFLTDAQAVRLWRMLLERGSPSGIRPVGLGARDTLRLEAGLRLCGTDMDATTTPYEADLGWTVALSKPSFIGKEVLARQKTQGVARRLVGFELAQGPIPRHGSPLMVDGRQAGTVTSGTFSLMLQKPIGLGYVESAFASPGTPLTLSIRSQQYPATVVKLPFWRTETSGQIRTPVAVSAPGVNP